MKWDIDDRNTLSLGYGLHSMVERMDAYFFEQNGVRTNKNLGLSEGPQRPLLQTLHRGRLRLGWRLDQPQGLPALRGNRVITNK